MLTSAVNRYYSLGINEEYPVIANGIIYKGAAVGENGSGYSRPLVAADPFQGFALATVDNSTGAAGVKNVVVKTRGKVVIPVVGASAVTANDKPAVYASDDNTFTLTSTSNSLIGYVSRWVSGTVCVVSFDAALSVFSSGSDTSALEAEIAALEAEITVLEANTAALEAEIAGIQSAIPVLTMDDETGLSDSIANNGFNFYYFYVSPSAEILTVDVLDLSADCDLYIKQGDMPSVIDYDYASETGGYDEQIVLVPPFSSGYWFVCVAGYGSANYKIRISENVVDVSDGVQVDGHAGHRTYMFYKVQVPSGISNLSITATNLTADADLFAKYGLYPNATDYDYMSDNSGLTDESISINNPPESTLYVSVVGWDAEADFKLTATLS